MARRDACIEWVKLIAILGVIFQHSVRAPELRPIVMITHGCVPAFTFLSVYFAVRSGLGPAEIASWLWRRFGRLYLLFLVWNVFYFGMRSASSVRGMSDSFGGFNFDQMFVSGYANALWFLPFIAVGNAIGFCVGRASKVAPTSRWMYIAICLAGGLFLAMSPAFTELRPPVYLLAIARKAVPSLLIGIAIGLMLPERVLRERKPNWRIVVACLAGAVASGWALLTFGRVIYLPETMLGASVIGLALFSAQREWWPDLDPRLSLWMFIGHPLILHGIRKAMLMTIHVDFDRAAGFIQLAAYGVLCLILATTFFFLRRLGWLRILLMEPKQAKAAI